MILYIGRFFSDDPSGRFYTDGDGSGEEFREEVLKPVLTGLPTEKELVINIDDNVAGYGSSFLVEAFGGLIKHGYFKNEEVRRRLKIEFKDEDFYFYKKKIMQYIDEAVFDSVPYKSTKKVAISKGYFKELIDKDFVVSLIKKN